ncbi:hypothetical protein A3C59_01905 [Candidatus Daviesbacteria bacterium RIFCSPHIGHO2_02_FULL_36_13]|uniref:Guanylate kinase n=1 Tax=Candidatus Daviesbacteria bacterium RIFCSPHIGHO2_02_FULL_36_13 TaxID=1797768 RepID=A0A1F5JSN4_9BACT|nr:MAG: hypothetical protein A3C59_01905 [Candidatus Daviesbacteria bacterium RIFCSPHIGHO2_02_FULL_36_13]
MLVVLTGKTASGKDTIKQRLLSKFPNLKKVITTTSRSLRAGEINDVDYHFLTREEFQKKIETGEFAEYVEYGGNLYGTYKSELEIALTGDVLWRIDPSRAGEVRDFLEKSFNKEFKVCVIYITAPDEVILKRLQRRNLPQEEIKKRMEDDKNIWEKYSQNYDFIVENKEGSLEETVDKVSQIVSRA